MREATETTIGAASGLLVGLLTEAQLEAETGWKPRTRLRLEAEGLPVVKIRGGKRYPVDKVRAWILGHIKEREAPRRGRPKRAA
jgi:hypothetical protein